MFDLSIWYSFDAHFLCLIYVTRLAIFLYRYLSTFQFRAAFPPNFDHIRKRVISTLGAKLPLESLIWHPIIFQSDPECRHIRDRRWCDPPITWAGLRHHKNNRFPPTLSKAKDRAPECDEFELIYLHVFISILGCPIIHLIYQK